MASWLWWIVGIALIAVGIWVLVKAPESPGGEISFRGLSVSSKSAGLPLVVLGLVAMLAPNVVSTFKSPNENEAVPRPGPTVTVTVGESGQSTASRPVSTPGPPASTTLDSGMPPPPGATAIYRAGNASAYRNMDSFGGGVAGDTTLWAREYGLATEDGTVVTVYSGKARPQPSDCAAIPIRRWSAEVLTKDLSPGLTLCMFTEEKRYGAVTIQSHTTSTGGDLTKVSWTYLLWKSATDD